ncbi:MAG: histidine phosphatase family protein [Actinomycetota bacterium]
MPAADSPDGPASATFFGDGPLAADTELWLIRHGETEWSKSGQHTGRTDLPMTAHGERQASALRDMIGHLRPVLVLSSPRQRAVRTAELAGLRIDDIDPDLVEWDYGAFEGLTTPQICQRVPGWSLWTHPVPDGETADEVSARADRVLRRAAAHLADGPVVLIAHGHISRVIAARWIGLEATGGGRFALGTAAPSVLGAQHGAPVIEHWNMPNPALTGQPETGPRSAP